MPKSITDSIRQNVAETMETETKMLKGELNDASEILDQVPSTLESYMKQVNTIKYLTERKPEFLNKF